MFEINSSLEHGVCSTAPFSNSLVISRDRICASELDNVGGRGGLA